MAPQVLYCTKITEKTQKWRSFHRKTITKKGINGTASAKLRINQQWYHQIENRWATQQAITQKVTFIHDRWAPKVYYSQFVVASLLFRIPGIVTRRMRLSVKLEAL